MASDFHLKLGNAKGESKHDSHKDEIEISSWSWGLSNAHDGKGSGSGSGSANFQEIHFVHPFDKSSPILHKCCAIGEHMDKAVLTGRKSGGGQQQYFTITLKEPFITSISASASSGGTIQEQFSVAYKDVEVTYKSQDEKGAMGGEVKFGYDLAAKKHR
jgi:type VI secretion system secreted protein Hcp